MSQVESTELKNRAVAGLVAEAAATWRLVSYEEIREAVPERTGVALSGTFDEKHRLGAVNHYLLQEGLPMASVIVVNENRDMQPGNEFVKWLVKERTGQDLDEVSEDRKRRIVADEQLETFKKAEQIREAVGRWAIA